MKVSDETNILEGNFDRGNKEAPDEALSQENSNKEFLDMSLHMQKSSIGQSRIINKGASQTLQKESKRLVDDSLFEDRDTTPTLFQEEDKK